MSSKKNIVMAHWAWADFAGLERFISSLDNTAFNGDVCIFVDHVAAETIERLLSLGVLVERTDRLITPTTRGQSRYYYHYLDFLARNCDEYGSVLITSPRDMIFQRDPFECLPPAEIAFTQANCLIGESPTLHRSLAEIYGEPVAGNLRDCLVSYANAVSGTVSGILSYLLAITTELSRQASRFLPHTHDLHQSVHNYIVYMRPIRGCCFDSMGSMISNISSLPQASLQLTPKGVLIGGQLTPILHQWDANPELLSYIERSAQFVPDARSSQRLEQGRTDHKTRRSLSSPDSIVAFYCRSRDTQSLEPFLISLRSAGFSGDIHCVGVFNEWESELMARHQGIIHKVTDFHAELDADNYAHFLVSEVLDELVAAVPSRSGQVLVLDSTRAVFLRNPFGSRAIGLSVFCEGSMRLGQSDSNRQWLALLSSTDRSLLQRPIISSSLFRGTLDFVRTFYKELFIEFVGRAELLNFPKLIQGAVNKICYEARLKMPVIVHPNGAEAYFGIWDDGLFPVTEPAFSVGGAVPFVVLNPPSATDVMRAAQILVGI